MSGHGEGLVFAEEDDVLRSDSLEVGGRGASGSGVVSDEVPGVSSSFVTQEDLKACSSSPEDTEGTSVVRADHACRYCGVDDPASVVRCLESNQWFCNGSGMTTASHIIHHLVRTKNKEVCLHPEGPLEDTVVECYNCGIRNAFTMGYLPAKGETMVVLLCRQCLRNQDLKELGWSMEKWTPVIQDRQFVPWLVKEPEETQEMMQLTTAQINRLEDLWKKDPKANLRDLDQLGNNPEAGVDDEVLPVERTYEDGFHYQEVFKPLVQMEADYDKEMKSNMREDNVSLQWRTSEVSGRISAVLHFSPAMSESLRITIGDELKLTLSKNLIPDSTAHKELMIMAPTAKGGKDGGGKGGEIKGRANLVAAGGRKKDWEGTGTVVHLSDVSNEIILELRTKDRAPTHVTSGFELQFVWKAITFERMQSALQKFAVDDNSVSGYMYHRLLGHEVEEQRLDTKLPKTYNVRGLPDLNESQAKAIQEVLTRPLALIQGPPGTGKTVTTASLVYHMVTSNQKEPVLVCAPSNVAVDHLTEKIHQTGLRVVRLSAKSREHLDNNIEHLTLHHMIQNLEDQGASAEVRRLQEKKERSGNQLSATDMKRLMRLRRELESAVLKAADVICCTCSGAGDPRLANRKFRRVLLDEATQATEPESLIPLVMGCKQFVLVGDHCQLGPVVMCKKAANAGLNSSLFERLVTVGLRPIRLTVQYRMHPALSEFPSNTFYEGSLQNGVSEADRQAPDIKFPWPVKEKPMMFFACTGAEELGNTGTSYLNRSEASSCEKVVSALLKGGARPGQIGVVTPYEGQRAYISTQLSINLKQETCREIEVSSVDAFQGREKDYIILSCVRSNEKQGIGFLNDPRRLNVALTRAKFGVVVLGNPRVLAKRSLWNTLLNHFQDLGLLVEGTINNLIPCQIKFPKVQKYYRDRRQRLFDEHAAKLFSGDVKNPYGDSQQNFPDGDNRLSALDSRHDAKYGGETHRQQQHYNQFDYLTGPAIRMPDIAMPASAQPPNYGQYQHNQQYQQQPYQQTFPGMQQQQQLQQMPKYRGYGDYDYQFRNDKGTQNMDSQLDATQAPSATTAGGRSQQTGDFTQPAFTQMSQTQQPFTQTGGLASQSQQFLTTQQSQSQSLTQSNTQAEYSFQDEDD